MIVEIEDIEICITAMLDIPEKEITMKASPEETFKLISDIVLDKTSHSVYLFHNKRRVKDSDTIGSLGCERLEMVAIDPDDKEKIRDYFRDGHATDSGDESGTSEDSDDPMEGGLGLFDL